MQAPHLLVGLQVGLGDSLVRCPVSIGKCQLCCRAFGLAVNQAVDLPAVQVFSSVLCNSSCTLASGSRFAAIFLRQNLTLSTAHLLSVKPDGMITLMHSCHGSLLLIGVAPTHLSDSSREWRYADAECEIRIIVIVHGCPWGLLHLGIPVGLLCTLLAIMLTSANDVNAKALPNIKSAKCMPTWAQVPPCKHRQPPWASLAYSSPLQQWMLHTCPRPMTPWGRPLAAL